MKIIYCIVLSTLMSSCTSFSMQKSSNNIQTSSNPSIPNVPTQYEVAVKRINNPEPRQKTAKEKAQMCLGITGTIACCPLLACWACCKKVTRDQ